MKHLFHFLSMAVLAVTACVVTSCEQKIDTPSEYLGKTKWESIDNPNGVYYYIELGRDYYGDSEEDKKKNFIYREYYFEDRFIPRPQYEIKMTGDWNSGYWFNKASEVYIFFTNRKIESTNPSYDNPDLNNYPDKLYYNKKEDRIVYKDRVFERIKE